ncbi:ceramidase [Coprinopsis sp. MPI-PUGE-AT-0042]|nr:ceramidase [Coprinopsis sp. MPI-PUGE-AT-0042]
MLNLTHVAPHLQRPGIWGPVTATLDWCEINYQFSPYVAEMANTFSNLFTVAISLLGLQHAASQGLPKRYIMGYLGVALVGVGSFFFHATLQFHAQLADELPMIYVASFSLWMLFDSKPGFSMRSWRTTSVTAAAVVFDILFTWSYIVYRNPIYHQLVFASAVFASTFRVAYLLKWSEQVPKIPKDKRASIGTLFASGAGMFALGFLIWNLDNIFCHNMTKHKLRVGWPQAFALEGHSWWHVLTGAGTYYMYSGIQYLTLAIKDGPQNYNVSFKHGLPHINKATKTVKSVS